MQRLPVRLCSLLMTAAVLLPVSGLAGCTASTRTTVVNETDETIDNWTLARRFQAEGRYELAKQHYSLALAAVRTQSALLQLQRELYTVDMQIRTMR